jgi:hypothetical protein
VLTTVFDAAVAARGERGDSAAHAIQERAVAAARVEVERLTAAIRGGDAVVTTRTLWGVPAYESIAAAAHEWPADLLVVGAHEPQSEHARLTDTDWQLMRRVACPLLLVKNGAFNGYERVVALARFEEAAPPGAADGTLAIARAFAVAFRAPLEVSGTELDLARALERRNCLLILSTPQARGGAGAMLGHAETAIGGSLCDVVLVPAAALERAAPARRSQIG